jgi:hypothetical protein
MTVYMKLKYLENKATKRKNCKRSYSVVFIVLSNQGPVIINSREEAGRDFEKQPKIFEVIWGGYQISFLSTGLFIVKSKPAWMY